MKNRIIVYAGQYYDAETGLHYNCHRYYDLQLGRYLRADPIGLAGGINPYVYVENNPINYIDPQGLESFNERMERVNRLATGIMNLSDLNVNSDGSKDTTCSSDCTSEDLCCKDNLNQCMSYCMDKLAPWWLTTTIPGVVVVNEITAIGGATAATVAAAGKAFAIYGATTSLMCSEICFVTPNCKE